MHALLLGRFGRIEGRIRSLGVTRYVPRRGELRVGIRSIPITAPLPDVPGHVVEAVPVGRELRDGRDTDESILARIAVLQWKLPLIDVRHELAARLQLLTPCIQFACHAAAR